jgi:uncharacterized peroxidase-related enzyme
MFGFIPKLARAQTLLPRLVEAQVALESGVLAKKGALSRVHKQLILLSILAAHGNAYCVTRHWTILRSLGIPASRLTRLLNDFPHADLSASEEASLAFALKVTRDPTEVSWEDIEKLRQSGFDDESILEAVLVTALGTFLCTLSTGLGPEPDFQPPPMKIGSPPEGHPERFRPSRPSHVPRKGPVCACALPEPKNLRALCLFSEESWVHTELLSRSDVITPCAGSRSESRGDNSAPRRCPHPSAEGVHSRGRLGSKPEFVLRDSALQYAAWFGPIPGGRRPDCSGLPPV